MKALTIVFILCLVLYRSGIISRLLEAVRMDEPQPLTLSGIMEEPHAPTLERRKLESIGANILLYEGYKGDAFSKAKRMTDKELNALIARFKMDIYGA